MKVIKKYITEMQYDLAYIRARSDMKRDIKKIVERSKHAVSPYMCLEMWMNQYLEGGVQAITW